MRLLIHCGLHKTGSTALQSALVRMSPALEERGVAFPSYNPNKKFAHHWLANALKGPHVFKKARDNISLMIDSAQASKPHTVCLSSEDFETSLRRAKAINRLMRIARRMDAKPVFLIYLRNQVEYFESLYLQFLRMGLRLDASRAVEEIVETGQFTWRKWIIQFDYAAMNTSLASTESDIILRNYHELENNCIIQDFLTSIDQPKELKPQAENLRGNPSRLDNNLQRFAKNCESNLDTGLLSQIDERMSGLRPRLSLEAQKKLKDRFWAGNAELESQFGIDLNQRFERRAPEKPVPVIDRIFETSALETLSRLSERGDAGKAHATSTELPDEWFEAV